MLKTKNTYIKHSRKNYKAKYINLARAESEALDDIMVCSNKIYNRVMLSGKGMQRTGHPGSVIVPQYGSSKITVFEWGKNTIPKFLGNTK